jgi:hypothetical protein
LTVPPHSEPRIHAETENHPFNKDDFSIIDSSPSGLLSLESMYIFKTNPTLNNHQSATPLLVSKIYQ